MRRILFSWRGFDVYSYPAMLYLGILAGIFAGAHVAQAAGLNADAFAIATIILTVPAIVGSRLLFVLAHWDAYRLEPSRIWRRSEGGMAMYGGLAAAVPLSLPLLYAMRLPFAAFWDAAAVTILVGMMFTRIGCLLNGCCSGRPTSAWFGVNLPDHRGIWRRRIPMQIVELVWAAIILAAALLMRKRNLSPGVSFCLIVITYGVGRFLMEPLRDHDTHRDTAILRTASLLLITAALAGITFACLRSS
jgi:phosphatidylglycerol:prolipoprotein diacylglycerol transferase